MPCLMAWRARVDAALLETTTRPAPLALTFPRRV